MKVLVRQRDLSGDPGQRAATAYQSCTAPSGRRRWGGS